jgi:hypothetical protein
VVEVAGQRQLDVDWRFIAQRILNEKKDYEKDFSKGYVAAHGTGLKLLRVCAAVRAEEGPGPMGDLYTPFGSDLHVNERCRVIRAEWVAGFPDYLRSVGVEEEYLDAANDERWDEILEAEVEEALSRTGRDVGTPIITFHGAESQSFFGPVISRVPRGPEAVELWDAMWKLSTFPGFAELKRSLRERPQTDS